MNTVLTLVLLVGAFLFWNMFNQACTVCEVIRPGEECWHCGAVKVEEASAGATVGAVLPANGAKHSAVDVPAANRPHVVATQETLRSAIDHISRQFDHRTMPDQVGKVIEDLQLLLRTYGQHQPNMLFEQIDAAICSLRAIKSLIDEQIALFVAMLEAVAITERQESEGVNNG